jgi:hypothetical protein
MMNITRVIQDGVEFFTIDSTGESGMSESGLAILCGVTHQSVNLFLRNRVASKTDSSGLQATPRASSRLQARGLTSEERSYISNLSIVRAEVCAEVIEHYAFTSKNKTPEALNAYRKFAAKGINAWIQEINHWHGNATPKNGIVIDFNTLELLLSSKLESPALRLYLYLTKALRLRLTPKTDEIINGAYLSKSTFSNACAKLQDLNLLPEWCKIQRRQQPEKIVRDRLQAKLGGRTESPTPWGPIDLLTATELIEIKGIKQWKEAIGHILVKSEAHPHHEKRLHLYGTSAANLDQIRSACTNLDIIVTFELVTKPEENSIVGT